MTRYAIAGDLFEIFGREMTTETGFCVECGTTAQLAELGLLPRTRYRRPLSPLLEHRVCAHARVAQFADGPTAPGQHVPASPVAMVRPG